MPSTFPIPLIVVIPGQLISASLWNNEWTNVYNGFTPAGVDDYSATDTEMQTETDPYPGGVISRPTSLQGELERLRYQFFNILGTTYWYQDPDVNIATFKSRFDAHTHSGAANQGPQIGTAGLADLAVTNAKVNDVAFGKITGTVTPSDNTITTGKIVDGAVTSDKLNAGVAGSGLAGGAGSALSVNVDNSTIEINSDTLRVKALGITNSQINDVAFGKVTGTVTPSDNTVTTDKIVNVNVTSAKILSLVSSKVTGTTTNDNAPAGGIGESFNSGQIAQANFTTSGLFSDYGFLALTAGDWDVSMMGIAKANGSTLLIVRIVISIFAGLSEPGDASEGNNEARVQNNSGLGTTAYIPLCIPSYRMAFTSTTNVYFKIRADYSGGTPTFVGRISARRVR